MARGYRELPRVSDRVIDLDVSHQASHVDHVPIMPLVSMAPGIVSRVQQPMANWDLPVVR